MGDFNFIPNPTLDKVNGSARRSNTHGNSQFNDALREQYGVSVNQLLLDAIVNPDAAANAQY